MTLQCAMNRRFIEEEAEVRTGVTFLKSHAVQKLKLGFEGKSDKP
jgi:hypothetical protein